MYCLFLYMLLLIISFSGLIYIFKSTRSWTIVSLPLVWYAGFIAFNVLRSYRFIQDDAGVISYTYFFVLFAAAVLFPVGVLFINIMFSRVRSIGPSEGNFINPVVPNVSHGIIFFMPVFLICLYLFLRYAMSVDGFALINDLSNIGSGGKLKAFRQNITTRLPGWHWYCMIFYVVLPFLATYTYMQYKILRNMKTFIPFVLFFGLALMTTTLSGHKDPVVFMFIMMWAAGMKSRPQKIRLSYVMKIGLLVSAILLFFYYVMLGMRYDLAGTAGWLGGLIFDRITLVYTKALYTLVNIFGENHDFLWGASLPNPRGIFSFEPVNLANFIYLEQRMITDSSNVGSAPTVFFGEFYANFGFVWMALSVYLMGILLCLGQVCFDKAKKNTLNYCLFLVIATKVLFLACGAFTNLFGPVLILLLGIYGYIRFLPALLKILLGKSLIGKRFQADSVF